MRGVNDAAYRCTSGVFLNSHRGPFPLDFVSVGLAPRLVWDVAVGDGRHLVDRLYIVRLKIG